MDELGVGAEAGRGDFKAVLGTDAVGALCDRFGLDLPVALQGSAAGRQGDPDRDRVFAVALAALPAGVAAGAAGAPRGDSAIGRVLVLLAAPEILVTVHRQRPGRVDSCFIAVVGTDAAEHRPAGPDEHRLAAYPADRVAARIIEFCELGDRPVPPTGPVRLNAAELLSLTETAVEDGDPAGAADLLAGRRDEAAGRAFVRALSTQRLSAHVTITRYTAPGRLEGTSTGFVDAGPDGLWRIPRPTVSPPWEAERADHGDLQWIAVEVAPVSLADVVAEMTEGFPGLG